MNEPIDLAAACRDLLSLWPLAGYELEAYMDATFVPAIRAGLAVPPPPSHAAMAQEIARLRSIVRSYESPHGCRLSWQQLHAEYALVKGQRDRLASCLVAYVEIEESRAPSSSSPLRERSRAALDAVEEGRSDGA